MTTLPASCARCGSPDPVAVAGTIALCEDCILKAIAARFPLGDVPLETLAAAVRAGPADRSRGRRARGA